jgi:hypothetical protein
MKPELRSPLVAKRRFTPQLPEQRDSYLAARQTRGNEDRVSEARRAPAELAADLAHV